MSSTYLCLNPWHRIIHIVGRVYSSQEAPGPSGRIQPQGRPQDAVPAVIQGRRYVRVLSLLSYSYTDAHVFE